MRPDPRQKPDRDSSGRIIYLGDVRRRRGSGRQQPDRHYLAALSLIALAAWAVWLAVVFSLSPSRLLTYLAFFAPLGLALAATATIGAYMVEWRRGLLPNLGRSVRRGILIAAVLILNLALQGAHRWSLPVGLGSVAVAVLADAAVFMARERR